MPGLRIGYLPQEPQLEPEQTVREAVEGGMGEVLTAKARLEEVYAAYAEPDADFDKLSEEQGQKLEAIIAAAGAESAGEHQLEIAADALRLPPWDAVIKNLSGRREAPRGPVPPAAVQARHAAARRTHQPPGRRIGGVAGAVPGPLPGTVVGITHDRYFLDNAAEWILELDRGVGIPYKGNYSTWLEQKEARLETEQRTEDARTKAMKKELEWARSNPKGRQAKSKARLARFEELSDYEYQKRNETNEIFIPVGERLGHEVIEFEREQVLRRPRADRQPELQGARRRHRRHHRPQRRRQVDAVQDDRRQGKPDSGEVKIGKTVQMAFVDQHRDELANNKTVWEDVSGGLDMINIGKFQMASRAYCGRFNFNGGDQQKKVGMLSGGERGRLHLAKTLLQGGNVLLLDEPSNDLDVETLRALEDALLEFAGSVMVISHDRWFLDRIATHILAAEDEAKWVFFDGNYQEYEADKRKRLGEEGARPHRVRYKALK
jgi:sulfate-transporting ATPase